MTPELSHLPIESVLPALRTSLAQHTRVVLSAPPGAGKTTRVPPALLSSSWLDGKKILMLEPRRLAARNAAEFMSTSLNEKTGTTVGYRIRGETRTSKKTRIEVVTEGILTRMLIQEQDLPGVGLVIFDEFHERSLHADLGLALTLDLQRHLRPDIRILVMSATLDVERISALLGDAPIVSSSGRMHPVDVHHARSDEDAPIETRMAAAIRRALRVHDGDVLAFLPGIREIRRTEERLLDSDVSGDVIVHLLYGDAGYDQQRSALMPAPDGRRKVILSTSIAETSLTIEGVTVVVDSGLARTVQYDPRRGMTGLVTIPVSQAIAEQRSGRAGRLGPGTCYRLWTTARHTSLPHYPTPEIKATDLTHVALDLAAWGDPTGETLTFLDPPPGAAIERSRGLLTELGALDASGQLTPHGRQLASLPVHPRYGHMIFRAKELGHGSLACDIAALLEERDILSGRRDTDIDLTARVTMLHRKFRSGMSFDRIRDQAGRFRDLTGIPEQDPELHATGLLLGLAYPDRVARRRVDGSKFQLSSGKTAVLPQRSVLDKHEFLAVGHVDGAGNDVRILMAAPITSADIEAIFADRITTRQDVRWDPSVSAVIARTVRAAGSLILDERPLSGEAPEIIDALLEGVRQMGIQALPWDKDALSLIQRVRWIRQHDPAAGDWPDCSMEGLASTADQWLRPFVSGMRRKEHLSKLSMKTILAAMFTHDQRRTLDAHAPVHIRVPSGSTIHISYDAQDAPVLAVKLQELFGLSATPTIGGGTVPLTIHLLSPAGRPLAVTQDLPSFWKNTYPEIRKQMRARYPKHPWPEDPTTAEPTRRTVRRSKR